MGELRQQDLAELRTRAFKTPEEMPSNTIAEFFPTKAGLRIHFLVWLPPKDREFLWSLICSVLISVERFPDDVTPAISWFISTTVRGLLNFEDATTASRNREHTQTGFKDLLKEEYHQPHDGKLFDMATGKRLPHSIVIASHIFQ
jgi:hypothetical protein